MEDLQIIPVEDVPSQIVTCFWTIHYSNFAKGAPPARC